MPRMHGINVIGYPWHSDETGNGGMQVCGMVELGHFAGWTTGAKKTPEKFIEEDLLPIQYNPKRCNIMFCITGSSIKSPDTCPGIVKYLLEHKNTRILYWYKNDAHGPNWIFVCIYHHVLPEKGCAAPGYTVAEIQARLGYDMGSYFMKDVG